MRILMVLSMVFGWINLLFYAYGNHQPSSLAIGIGGLFVATWLRQRD